MRAGLRRTSRPAHARNHRQQIAADKDVDPHAVTAREVDKETYDRPSAESHAD